MVEEITVLLVDDHILVRRGFRRLLEDEAHIRVVGEASNGAEAVKLADRLKPKVILMDCAMPGMSGLIATRQIVESRPEIAVLMLSMHPEETWVRQAVAAGARGYLLKNAADLDLVSAIERAMAGDLVLDPQISKKASETRNQREPRLGRREMEVLQLIVAGQSNRQIAQQLGLSKNTIAAHRAGIMKALAVRNAAELVAYAFRNGLVAVQ